MHIDKTVLDLCTTLNVSEETIKQHLSVEQIEELNKRKQKKITERLKIGKCCKCSYFTELQENLCKICFSTSIQPEKAYGLNILSEINQNLLSILNHLKMMT